MARVRSAAREGRRLEVTGIVQAVGFRPFVYRLARELALDGRVRNAAGRVEIEVAGDPHALDALAHRLRSDAPPRARVESVVTTALPVAAWPNPGAGFTILESVAAASAERLFPPDIATCDDCLRELFDPADRRYRYPFINCTNCGPRATIIDDLPYDRARTSMRDFPLCPVCEAEYRDPANRRFHAEPVACPACGPRLAYRRTGDAAAGALGEDALAAAVSDIAAGRVVAIKGLGGYHLACDATNPVAVERLRDRKRRWAKPLAVMVRDLASARAIATVTDDEAQLLTSPARPIVLVRRRTGATVLVDGVARGDRRVGLFLPYTPLHHLLLAAVGRPIVLTSGNLSDEPLAIDDDEALRRLGGIADAFLQHDREIRARYDDSVTRVVGGRESIIRRGRGYAPDPLDLPFPVPEPLLAAGAELKHTFTLASGDRAYVAPHTGDLEDMLTFRAFEGNLSHLRRLLDLDPRLVAHDLHPAYLSTQFAARHFPAERRVGVQHHHAHVASCAAEAGITSPFIGLAYDGLGMGDDGTFWGGEVLIADLAGYRRFGRFALAPMPGGAMAVKKPYRMALGYLYGLEDDDGAMRPIPTLSPEPDPAERGGPRDLAAPFLEHLDPREVAVVLTQVSRSLNAPRASSAGRLFDAVASLLGIRDVAEYEAQAAIELEMRAEPTDPDAPCSSPGARAIEVAAGEASPSDPTAPLRYRLVRRAGLLVYDPAPTLSAILEGRAAGAAASALAARFQETIAEVSRELAGAARAATGIGTVCLSGGVFQNRWLATALLVRLAADGFEVFINRLVPVNDGGISYGQAAVVAARFAGGAAGDRVTHGPARPAAG
jgi:hydrogenase maturation protein HypF